MSLWTTEILESEDDATHAEFDPRGTRMNGVFARVQRGAFGLGATSDTGNEARWSSELTSANLNVLRLGF